MLFFTGDLHKSSVAGRLENDDPEQVYGNAKCTISIKDASGGNFKKWEEALIVFRIIS